VTRAPRPARARRRPPRPRHAYHHGNLRQALIDAALVAIAKEGPEAFTLRDAARRAGVSAGAPYRHFRDKEELLAAVAADAAERIGAVMVEAVARAGSEPLARFRATGIAYVRFAVTNPAHFRVMNRPGMAARVPEPQRAAEEAWRQQEYRALAEAQARGEIAAVPLEEIMAAAYCLVHGLAHAIVEGQEGFRGLDADAATAVAMAVTGVFGVGLIPR
jgi:AcrR family transcriptional regulator